MHHNLAARAAALALCVGVAWGTLASADPSACARGHTELDREQKRVVVTFENGCDARVGCAVSWTVRCGRSRVEHRSEQLRIDARGEATVTASAQVCGDDEWRISDPRWRCDEPEGPVTESSKPPRRRRR